MNKKLDVRNASFAYSVNMLRILREMKLITDEEYKKIIEISAKHYDVDIYCV